MLLRAKRPRRLRLQGGIVITVMAACGLLGTALYNQKARSSRQSQSEEPGESSNSLGGGLRRPLRQKLSEVDEKLHDPWSCPLVYERTEYEDVKQYKVKPYLLGGLQRPECVNCHKQGELWSEFCQFKSHGPACPEWAQWKLLDTLIERAEQGAEGAKELLTFTPCDLFELLEGRTLWLIGDSMTQEFQRALQCFFMEFWELQTHELAELTADPEAATAAGRLPQGWCIFMTRNTKICHLRSNYGEEIADVALPLLPELGATDQDVVVFNFGAWHNDFASFQGNATKLVGHIFRHWEQLPFLIWREVAPQHFDTPLGEFGCDSCPDPTVPYECREIKNMTLDTANRLSTTDGFKRVLVEGGWRNREASPRMTRLGLPSLRIYNQSLPLWHYHHSFSEKEDCTHMCHPSAYQLWVFELFSLLRTIRDRLPPLEGLAT